MNSALFLHGLMSSSAQTITPWVRHVDWLEMPVVSVSDNKFVGLLAVTNNDSNYVALTAWGAYTVDWGDGTVENVASGTDAQHMYDFSAIPAATLSSRGYKQVIVTVTPQAGQTFTDIRLQTRHSAMPASVYNVQWLDIAVGGESLSGIRIATATGSSFSRYLNIGWCERVNIVRSVLSPHCDYMFYYLTALRVVSVPVTMKPVTGTVAMFQYCRVLQEVPLFDTSIVTTVDSMFSGCGNLYTIPDYDTSNVAIMNNMFNGCHNLQKVPLLNTAASTGMSSMFSGCSSLRAIVLNNTDTVTNMGSMFSGCSNLQSVTLSSTASATTTSGMFQNCRNLATLPASLDTTNSTNVKWMFQGCYELRTIPPLNIAKATDAAWMFDGCVNLQTVPVLDTGNVTAITWMFYNCPSLHKVELTSLAKVTSTDNMFNACTSLATVVAPGAKVAISYTNCKLSTAAIVQIFNGLADLTGLTSRTITISGNWGAATLTTEERNIALNKNWAITG